LHQAARPIAVGSGDSDAFHGLAPVRASDGGDAGAARHDPAHAGPGPLPAPAAPPSAIPDLDSGRHRPQEGSTAEVRYPHLALWITGGGWVELGRAGFSRAMARALDEGGMVWEGKARYTGLDELLRDLDEGIA